MNDETEFIIKTKKQTTWKLDFLRKNIWVLDDSIFTKVEGYIC